MRNKQFWLDLVERAIKTFAQALLATLTVGVPIWDLSWIEGLGIAATATVISILTSLASGGTNGTASAIGIPPTGHQPPHPGAPGGEPAAGL